MIKKYVVMVGLLMCGKALQGANESEIDKMLRLHNASKSPKQYPVLAKDAQKELPKFCEKMAKKGRLLNELLSPAEKDKVSHICLERIDVRKHPKAYATLYFSPAKVAALAKDYTQCPTEAQLKHIKQEDLEAALTDFTKETICYKCPMYWTKSKKLYDATCGKSDPGTILAGKEIRKSLIDSSCNEPIARFAARFAQDPELQEFACYLCANKPCAQVK